MKGKAIIIIIVVLFLIAIAAYFIATMPKTYINEIEENGIVFKSDSNFKDLVNQYKNKDQWVFFGDITDVINKGPIYSCSLLYGMVTSANNKELISLLKTTEQGITFCAGYDSNSGLQKPYSQNQCNDILSSNLVIEVIPDKDKAEIILEENKVTIYVTNDTGYETCTYFLDLIYDTTSVGLAVKKKIQDLDTSSLKIPK